MKVAQELRDRHPKCKLSAFISGRHYLVDNIKKLDDTPYAFNRYDVLNDMTTQWLNTPVDYKRLEFYRKKLGDDILRKIITADREIGYGYVVGGYVERTPLIDYFEKNKSMLDDDAQRRLYENPLRILDSKNPKMQDMLNNAPKLKDFISRFSANASKSKQATSRRKMLDNLDIEEIKPSSRRYPGITFHQEREAGNQILNLEGLSKRSDEGEVLFSNVSFTINKGDKIGLTGKNGAGKSTLLKVLAKDLTPNKGNVSVPNGLIVGFLRQDLEFEDGRTVLEEAQTAFEFLNDEES